MEELPRRMQTDGGCRRQTSSSSSLPTQGGADTAWRRAALGAALPHVDRVQRQAQWLDAPVSKHAISDYLVKVTCTRLSLGNAASGRAG